MYLPQAFALTRPDELARLLHAQPFGALVSHGPDGLTADHLPFEFDPAAGPHGTLWAHVARANPLWQRGSGAQVLVIFSGAQGYVSPSWYPSKAQTQRQVPTWNYEVVHAHGTLHAHDDPQQVRAIVTRLTARHEAGEPQPWRLTDSPPEYIERMLREIVGIEIRLSALVGKAKLGQNKDARDRLGAADRLAERGHTALAAAMRRAG